jgi:hypothetical protein
LPSGGRCSTADYAIVNNALEHAFVRSGGFWAACKNFGTKDSIASSASVVAFGFVARSIPRFLFHGRLLNRA